MVVAMSPYLPRVSRASVRAEEPVTTARYTAELGEDRLDEEATRMTRYPNFGLYAVAVAIAVVGALWLGVPAGTLAMLAVALACPLMMMFMMSGMHGGHGHRSDRDRDDRDSPTHH